MVEYLSDDGPYARLRPPAPTPPAEHCVCPGEPPIKLMQALSYNPLHCMRCHGEVAPDRLALPADVVDAVADWRAVYDALDRLWLDSGLYEFWAARELATLTSPVNETGLALRAELDARVRRCYYWLFGDFPPDHAGGIIRCPQCNEEMMPYMGSRVPQRVCERCSLVADGGK